MAIQTSLRRIIFFFNVDFTSLDSARARPGSWADSFCLLDERSIWVKTLLPTLLNSLFFRYFSWCIYFSRYQSVWELSKMLLFWQIYSLPHTFLYKEKSVLHRRKVGMAPFLPYFHLFRFLWCLACILCITFDFFVKKNMFFLSEILSKI